MHWHEWVVLIAGSTASHYVLFALPNLHIVPDAGTISLTPRVRWVSCTVHLWPSWPTPFLPSCRQARPPRRSLAAAPTTWQAKASAWFLPLGIADHGQRAGGEQAAQIAITSLADTAELFLAPARVLLRQEPDPGSRNRGPTGKPLDQRRRRAGGGQRGGQRLEISSSSLLVLLDRCLEHPQLSAKRDDTCAGDFRHPVVFCIGKRPGAGPRRLCARRALQWRTLQDAHGSH